MPNKDLVRKTARKDVGGNCTECQHYINPFRLPTHTAHQYQMEVLGRARVLYQHHKANKDNDWPYKGGCQKLSS